MRLFVHVYEGIHFPPLLMPLIYTTSTKYYTAILLVNSPKLYLCSKLKQETYLWAFLKSNLTDKKGT